MKKMFLCLMAMALCCTFQARAQWAVIDPSNLAQNILTVSKTATTASNVINSFKEMQKIYSQGKEYYDALKSVHNLIKDARKVKETVEMVSEISKIYATSYNKMLTDKNFTVAELDQAVERKRQPAFGYQANCYALQRAFPERCRTYGRDRQNPCENG